MALRYLLWSLLLVPVLAPAATVLGVVSERSAAEVAAGAHEFLGDFPGHTVMLRTPEQLADKSDEEVIALWQQADALMLGAVFGDQTGRLERLLRQQGPAAGVPILAVNSDRRITQLSRLQGESVLESLSADQVTELTINPEPGEDPKAHLAALREQFPAQADWLNGRAFYQGRSPEHIAGLMRWLLAQAGYDIAVPEPEPRESIRYYRPFHGDKNGLPGGESRQGATADPGDMALDSRPAVALLDLDSGDRPGDRHLLDAICAVLESRGTQCFAVLSRWGGASEEAVSGLAEAASPAMLSAVVSLQDFVVGGGEGRRGVTQAFEALNLPVIKGMRLSKQTETEWLLSAEGISRDDVHYRLAMPELQGISQPLVLAVAQPAEEDAITGVRLSLTHPLGERVNALADRLQRWQQLQVSDNADKKVALIYYNHPPGRQNVGADKLDVPESLFEILQRLKAAGYDTGELPESAEALLDMIQDRGINLLEDRGALAELADRVPALSHDQYQDYFATLPKTIQAELEQGPLGYLHANLEQAHGMNQQTQALGMLEQGINDLRHMLQNHDHRAQARALDLLEQYDQGWRQRLQQGEDLAPLAKLRDAMIRTGIPGLSGWGEAPGQAMIHNGHMLFPGLYFGNVFIGPQPPRGWEISEALLHANTRFPPTHHYVGFYHWLREHFQADALVYLGRHSTREFLPRRRAGLAADDYPDILGGDLPVLYPYIVDGVGEGIQAKRRAMGVMISHLTPPLATTELYDKLLELRQLVETYESASDPDSPTRRRAAETLRERIHELDLTAEIENELAHGHHHHGHGHGDKEKKKSHDHDDDHGGDHGHHHDDHNSHGHNDDDAHSHSHSHHDHDEEKTHHHEHDHGDDHGHGKGHDHGHTHEHDNGDSPLRLEDVDEELLVHEVGHYLTEMQERFMPLGLHVFGRDWDDDAIDIMLTSMAGDGEQGADWRRDLSASPSSEMNALLAGLAGGFIAPGQGNDPVRTPEVLPTGRNFHALSGDLIPTRTAWSLGQEMAKTARERGDPEALGSEAIILWASDTVRDEGVMIAFALDMLGVRPQWNSRGIVGGLERMPVGTDRQRRRDALFTTSGLFRDLYEDQLVWLDHAVRVALDGASETIRELHPQLVPSLEAALASLPDNLRDPGSEALAENDVAARWVEDTRALLAAGTTPDQAGQEAALRVFGTAPGAYGTGVNRLTERSGAWEDRSEVAAAYQRRMGHAYGADSDGQPAHAAFSSRLQHVGRTYLGRASHMYGLLDNNDGFDFQGGLSLAVEMATGSPPDNRVLTHADPDNPRVESLERALLGELRARNLNPQWLKPLMDHGYSGARTMGADFLDNLWGWQVTSPEVVRSWVWDAIHDVYFQDSHGIGLDDFLEQGHNIHVKTHMQAITLVAAHRGFWEAEDAVIDAQAESFAEAVVEHGLPGGGHTRPDHPTMDWVAERLADDELREAFNAVRAAAQIQLSAPTADPARITELTMDQQQSLQEAAAQQAREDGAEETGDDAGESAAEGGRPPLLPWLVLLAALLIIAGGVMAGRRTRV
ncbi:MAG: cobaltochelatase subunit CobN [Halomonadaceae bacterium]|nr:MAG: cobaltochelatase subunit CobN [Halomonadaceae bacterium]